MTEERVFKLDKIPEDSRLERYLKELPKVLGGSKGEILSYLNTMFVECVNCFKLNMEFDYLLQITLMLVTDREEFKKLEKVESQKATSKEQARLQATAFVVGNKFAVKIYMDLESFINMLNHGLATFVLNVVETYFHEILHAAFPQKFEQEIHTLQCPLIEQFLGISLPEEIRNINASDYYSSNANT